MFARFDENPAITLQDIKNKKTLRTDGRTHARTHGQRENSIPTTNKVCGGYKKKTLRTDANTHARTDNVKTVYPPQTKFAGGIKMIFSHLSTKTYVVGTQKNHLNVMIL